MLIKTHLPEALLTAIGAYMQTAAHIEWNIWQTLLLINPSLLGRDEKDHFKKAMEAKLYRPNLLKECRAIGKLCSEPLAARIAALAEQIKNGLPDRALVAHGAFGVDSATGVLSVWRFPDWEPGKVPIQEEIITDEVVNEALRQIDGILFEVVQIKDKLQQGQKPRGTSPS